MIPFNLNKLMTVSKVLHGTKCIDQSRDPDNFAPCKRNVTPALSPALVILHS